MGAPGPSARDWSEMPFDALTSVFAKLAAVELLMGAELVCRSWLEAAKAPELWRAVVMMCQPHNVVDRGASLCAMAKEAVDRSGRLLEKFVIRGEEIRHR
ncbi:hypothetical protein CFC21_100000 [Triticum aestivum]|uniref:F-box domain-containing protein n=2 Tax=Triticum aestivum TaxID=4565 RepID=A0A3B6RM36_WHEAT|nr:hypothetical protein CFC21_100000 [Triticum aestivum]